MDMNKVYKATTFLFIGMIFVGVATAVVVNIDGSNLTPLSWFNSNKTVWDAKGNASYPLNVSNATGKLPSASIPESAANISITNIFTAEQNITQLNNAHLVLNTNTPSSGSDAAILSKRSGLNIWVYGMGAYDGSNDWQIYGYEGAGNPLKINNVTGRLIYSKPVNFTSLTAASGTPNDVCINSATKELVENPALTCTVSLKEQKTNFTNITQVDIDRLMQLNITKFEFKNQSGDHFGETAQHVAEIYPELARYNQNGLLATYEILEFIPLLIKQNQEQQKQIDLLEAKVRRLELTKP